MPDPQWVRMRFKKNKVWVAADDDGNPVVEKGKCLIKYQLDQPHEYQVLVGNLHKLDEPSEPIPDAAASRPLPDAPDPPADDPPGDPCGDVIEVFTDGASSGNPGPSGIGVFLSWGGHEKEISRYIGSATNNIAELEAIRTALKSLKRYDIPVRLYTDSSYAHGVLTAGWKPKKNLDLIDDIKGRISQFEDIQLIKVRGHAGNPGNERADGLATRAIRKAAGG